MKKAVLALLSLLLLITLAACKDERKEEYAKALELLDNEKYEEAIEILEPLGDYELAKDHLWFAKIRIIEDHLIEHDYRAGYEYLKLQDDQFLAYNGMYIEPLLCSFVETTYRYLDDDLKEQYIYAGKIAEAIKVTDGPVYKAIDLVSENFDKLLDWQSADKLITGCDDSLNFNYEVVTAQWKEKDYNSIGFAGTTFRDEVVFYLNDGLKLNETGNRIFELYDLMASNLEAVYLENSYDKKKSSFDNFLGFYDLYQSKLETYQSEYLTVITQLDELVESFY